MKRTIEDLTISKTFYNRYRDDYGNRVKEPYQKDVKRKVKLVTGWLRFAHYILDGIILGVINFGFDFAWFSTVGQNSYVSTGSTEIWYQLIPTFDDMFILAAYYFICEHYLQRTIGKYATNSVVINEYAEAPAPEKLIGRSFARLVPFEALSCLGDRGWHDRWSKTYVVTIEERDALKRLLNEQDGIFISDSEDLLD